MLHESKIGKIEYDEMLKRYLFKPNRIIGRPYMGKILLKEITKAVEKVEKENE